MSDEIKTSAVEPTEPIGEGVSLPDSVEKGPDYYGQLLRLKAEFENYRKRVDRDKPEWVKLGGAGVIIKLLPLYDLLRHAYQEVHAKHGASPLAAGMDAIFREFEKLFREEGVSQVDPAGKPFDPHYHEALGFTDRPGCEEGAVAEVLQVGFLLADRVLRTAKVRLQKREVKL